MFCDEVFCDEVFSATKPILDHETELNYPERYLPFVFVNYKGVLLFIAIKVLLFQVCIHCMKTIDCIETH